MNWLVDTNVLSETTKKTPSPVVLKWLEANAQDIYTSSHVIAELAEGIAADKGRRKQALQAWLNRLVDALGGRIKNFNTSVAIVWGQQEAEYAARGCPMPMPDSFIAATARKYNMTIVTRNTEDFNRPGLRVFNPFAEG